MENVEGFDRSRIIISILCSYLEKDFKDFESIINEKDNKYLLLLLLKNHKCLNKERIKNMFNISSNNSISYSIRKAEERLLINKNFRENYFKIEKYIQKVI